MQGIRLAQAAVFAAGVLAMAASSLAGEITVGTKLDKFTLNDQNDMARWVDEGTRLVLFSKDKEVAKMAFKVLDQKPPTYLSDRGACILLDISPMPRIITWMFGKPKMRSHAFPILLDAGPGPTRTLPAQEKKLSLIFLNQLTVEKIVYVSNEAELAKEFEALSP